MISMNMVVGMEMTGIMTYPMDINIRYKDGDERGFVHTISATAMTDRAAIAILENNQRADGSVVVPEVLRPFTGFDVIEPVKH